MYQVGSPPGFRAACLWLCAFRMSSRPYADFNGWAGWADDVSLYLCKYARPITCKQLLMQLEQMGPFIPVAL